MSSVQSVLPPLGRQPGDSVRIGGVDVAVAHGFAIDEATLPPNVRVIHRSLFDGSNQGIELTDAPAFSFQGHPEASPGPHDVSPLFDRFVALMEAN